MARSFKQILDRVEKEAGEDGAQADVARLREHFRLGRKLAERRIELGLSQESLARKTGLQQGDISRIERGTGNPTFGKLSAVAAGLEGTFEFRPTRRAARKAASNKARRRR